MNKRHRDTVDSVMAFGVVIAAFGILLQIALLVWVMFGIMLGYIR